MFQYVDHVNIMAYDGQWDDGYDAANLSPYPYTENIVNYWTSLFDTHQISKGKLVLGVPFYAQPEDPNSKQISYKTIIENNPKFLQKVIPSTLTGTPTILMVKKRLKRKQNSQLTMVSEE